MLVVRGAWQGLPRRTRPERVASRPHTAPRLHTCTHQHAHGNMRKQLIRLQMLADILTDVAAASHPLGQGAAHWGMTHAAHWLLQKEAANVAGAPPPPRSSPLTSRQRKAHVPCRARRRLC